MNINGIILKVVSTIFLLLTFNVAAADTLRIGTMFTQSGERDGINFAIQEQNKNGGYSVELHYSSDCTVKEVEKLRTESKVHVLLSPNNPECVSAMRKADPKHTLLHVCLFCEATPQPNEEFIVLPQSDFPLTEGFKNKYKKHYLGIVPNKWAGYGYKATKIFLKAIEKSGLLPEQLGEESAEKIKQKLNTFRVIRVSVAGIRHESSDDGIPPAANNPIRFVLHKGDNVIELGKRGDWLHVESFSNPKQQGWVHRLLVKGLHKSE